MTASTAVVPDIALIGAQTPEAMTSATLRMVTDPVSNHERHDSC